jgi:hypothetical protein
LAVVARPAVPVLAASVLAGKLDLTELVADHALFDLRQRPLVGQNLDVVAVARIRRDPAGRGVRMRQQAQGLQIGQDVSDRGAAHPERVVRDKRARADGRRRGHVFVDDGPQDCVGSRIERADGAAWSSRHF